MTSPPAFAAVLLLTGLLCNTSCTVQPALGPRTISHDRVLLFEQRRATAQPTPEMPAWEAWQLYESGRFVHSRADTEMTQRRLDAQQLSTVRAWLRAHDFELVQNSHGKSAPAASHISAICQIHLSTGLVLAPLGDPRYYACDELKRLSEAHERR